MKLFRYERAVSKVQGQPVDPGSSDLGDAKIVNLLHLVL
jgi:hypothetical protein